MGKRIWIDVTDFLKWQGAFTGFQNIQYHIAKEYITSGRNVAFFIYEEATHTFKEVEFDPDEVSKDGIVASGVIAPEQSSGSLLQVVKRYTPISLKKAVKRAARGKVAASVPVIGTQSPFTKEDTVVVLGGIWHGSFAEDVVAEKKKKNFAFIHIVHDMIPVKCPHTVVEDLPKVFGAYKDKILRAADGLIINSESSRRDALEFMKERGIKPPPSIVFRIADEPKTAVEKRREGVSGDFILSVGTIEGRKNHALLYYAYKQGIREGIELPTLILAGRNGWLTDDIRYMIEHDPDVKELIRIHNGVTDSELTWLFNNCLFTIWPSFYEGWGMPVAESMTHGKVCLSSDVSSMPEIAPNLVQYFSPYDSSACLKMIVKYLDKSTRKALEGRIKKEYQVTTWRNMYETISTFIDKY